jgi:uncharacterized membrane protein
MPDDHRFVAVVYASYGAASEALTAVQDIDVVDAAVVVKQPGGHLDLYQTRGTSIGEGAVTGGTVGLLAGLLFGLPVAAGLIGLAAGGGWGSRDLGIPDDRLRQLGRELEPRHAVLCVLLEPTELPLLEERLAPYGGDAVDVAVTPSAP